MTNAMPLRLSTIATAQDVLTYCADVRSLSDSVAWCRDRGIGKVYLETYRGKTRPEADILATARRAFETAGIEAAGCVCSTDLGENSNGWPGVPCFSRGNCAGRLEEIFRQVAPHFDELIIDNRLFTDCSCEACEEQRGARTWTEFRQDLMVEICERHVLEPALDENPRLQLVFKYPSWYEGIAERGYDVVRHTDLFHRVCAGAETRDPTSEKWGKRQPYGAFFTTHWYHQVCGEKCLGSWIDTIACSPEIFMAQVRGSVLGGAKEIVLFCMGLLRAEEAKPDREILAGREHLGPLCADRGELDRLAATVAEHPPCGVAAYRVPGGDAGGEPYVFEHLGMAGIPLYASAELPVHAPAAAFGEASAAPDLTRQLADFVGDGKPALVTSRLSRRVGPLPQSPQIHTIDTAAHFFPDRMRTQETGEEVLPEMSCVTPSLETAKRAFLEAVGCPVEAPTGVGVTLLGDRYVVLQNFGPESVVVRTSIPAPRELTVGPWAISTVDRQGLLASSPASR